MKLDLSGLEQFKASALWAEPPGEPVAGEGAPLNVALEVIDFDPEQPRRGFEERSLEELAASIAVHGVLEPVALRSHPQCVGRYVVNRGERRVRACRLAGLATVPAFIDEHADRYAQVIENLQREALSPFDLAGFVAERERAGESRAEIARRLHKPASFISEVAVLRDASAALRAAFDAGRVADLRVLYRLARGLREKPAAVEPLIAAAGPITRQAVEAALRPVSDTGSIPGCRRVQGTQLAHALLVEHGGRRARLGWSRPPGGRTADLQFDDGSRERVDLAEIKLLEWIGR